jgi:hypothetical protein
MESRATFAGIFKIQVHGPLTIRIVPQAVNALEIGHSSACRRCQVTHYEPPLEGKNKRFAETRLISLTNLWV